MEGIGFRMAVGVCWLGLAVLAAGCGDKKWDARPLDHKVSLELNGVPLTVSLPEGMVQADTSERQAIFETKDVDGADPDGVWPNLVVGVSTFELPRSASDVAIDDTATDIVELAPNLVRVRYDGETTLSETYFRGLPSGQGYTRCEIVLYSGKAGFEADHERRRKWMRKVCDGVRAR